jgi:hypothetical protein
MVVLQCITLVVVVKQVLQVEMVVVVDQELIQEMQTKVAVVALVVPHQVLTWVKVEKEL